MMLSRTEAAEAARAVLLNGLGNYGNIPMVLHEEDSIEYPFGWVFFWGPTDEWVKAQESPESATIDGIPPILVDRRSGSVYVLPSGDDCDLCAERYVKSGSPYMRIEFPWTPQS